MWNALPDFPTLTKLKLGKYQHDLPNIPLLESLTLDSEIAKPIDGKMLKSLTELDIRGTYNHQFIGFDSLKVLKCSANVTGLHGSTFPSLKILTIDGKYLESIVEDCFPVLETLMVSSVTDSQIATLPLLKVLDLSARYAHDINTSTLPSLTKLTMGMGYKFPVDPQFFSLLRVIDAPTVVGIHTNIKKIQSI